MSSREMHMCAIPSIAWKPVLLIWLSVCSRSCNSVPHSCRIGRASTERSNRPIFETFEDPVLGPTGLVTFNATLQIIGEEEPYNHPDGIWSDRAGELSAIRLEGDQAPGVPSGNAFESFDPVVMNSSGQIAFRGGLQSGGGTWSEGSGTLTLIARVGSQEGAGPACRKQFYFLGQ